MNHNNSSALTLRQRMYDVIFGYQSRAGRRFDLALILVIILSLLIVMLESIHDVADRYGHTLRQLEWFFTILFTVEYACRVYCANDRWKYIRSGWGIIDLMAFLPTYIAWLFPPFMSVQVLRAVRMLRIFRILNLQGYLQEATKLGRALKTARGKILVFLFSLLVLAIVFGTTLYLVEHGQNGFTSIPKSIYWAIITITTVGYGDIAPITPIGQIIAALVTLTGYSIIAVPTGIITAEITREVHALKIITDPSAAREEQGDNSCRNCGRGGHDQDARHCKHCGAYLAVMAIEDGDITT